jgi:hypothetical protein
MDAVRLLFMQLDEIYDEPRQRSRWVASHRDRSFMVDLGEKGYIREVPLTGDHEGKAIQVPSHLVNSLVTQILERPRQERYAAFMATSHLVDDWYELLLDGETLLGHLLRAHSAPNESRSQTNEDLWAAHSKLHGKARRGSIRVWHKLTLAHARGMYL